ncbi:MAG: gliding motility lipoprotein GldH [Ekhidna sp.]|nr:gliding motility lipoprotein GldH [Ekhidna sp.]
MKYLILFSFILLLESCDSSRVYEDFQDMDQGFWHSDSLQSFSFEIEDAAVKYNLLATFRHASAYPFYNLYFQYSLLDSSGNVIKKALKEHHFFDPKTGEPLGSGLGDLFDHEVMLEESYSFPNGGRYQIQLQQRMRMDTLAYILSVGARVEIANGAQKNENSS